MAAHALLSRAAVFSMGVPESLHGEGLGCQPAPACWPPAPGPLCCTRPLQRLIDERVENGQCFQWQSQLRYYQNEKTKECQVGRGAGWVVGMGVAVQGARLAAACIAARRPTRGMSLKPGSHTISPTFLSPSWPAQVNICDAEIKYMYEYIGNCGCLCITPLTDRCEHACLRCAH